MIKIENKRLTFTAVILTLIFIAIASSTLIFNSTGSAKSRYIGIKPDGRMVVLQHQDKPNV
ncbi:MAG: hypothetical protein ACJA0H_002204 [Francisellaceae bacterium]|jgi:hypothetical protein